MEDIKIKTCPICNSNFDCTTNCWCNDFPSIMPINPERGCLCKNCLKKEVAKKIDTYLSNLTPKKRKTIQNLGSVKNTVEGIDYYINNDNLFVFTAWYHLRRGYCCKNNCLHCPYKITIT